MSALMLIGFYPQKLDVWREDYNRHRPHSSIGNLKPNEFINNSQKKQISVL